MYLFRYGRLEHIILLYIHLFYIHWFEPNYHIWRCEQDRVKMSTANGDDHEPANTDADELTQLHEKLALMQQIHALQLNIPALQLYRPYL